MTLRRTVATAFALALAMAPTMAGAAPIVTAALERATFIGEFFTCRVVNAGTASANVTIQLMSSAGASIRTKTVSLLPGYTNSVSYSDIDPQYLAYCRVTGIAKRDARVTLSVQDLNHTIKGVATAP